MEEGYDKKVYENTVFSVLQILAVFTGFYAFNWIMTWGLFEFGMWDAEAYSIFSLILFIFVCFGLCAMTISGYFVNQKKHMAAYLKTKISDKKARKDEEEQRKKMDAETAAKVALRKQQSLTASQTPGAPFTADGARN